MAAQNALEQQLMGQGVPNESDVNAQIDQMFNQPYVQRARDFFILVQEKLRD